MSLEAQLATMAHGEDHYAQAIEAVEGEVAAAPERDPPLPELGIHALRRPARFRVGFEQAHPVANDAHGPARRIGVFLNQEAVQAGKIGQRSGRPD